jgi:hypothetical protein
VDRPYNLNTILNICNEKQTPDSVIIKAFETEREALRSWYHDLHTFHETTKRTFEMTERLLKEASYTYYMIDQFNNFPENFI